MRSSNSSHSFHIPVLGVGFSVDAPLKVGHLGISSVMSIIADSLLEKLRAHYLQQNNIEYIAIDKKAKDYRARRVTAYLDLVDQLVQKRFNAMKSDGFNAGSELHTYFTLLEENSELRKKYERMMAMADSIEKNQLQNELLAEITPGSSDVNIMTKIDKPNYDENGEKLSAEFNDAHAALRGFANSTLSSSLVLSAGMNPRLYGYMENFSDFFPDSNDQFNKKIVIKVSDFRSAVIQGKFLAKKGLWVSEFRIESGLNCGGHAFATDGLVLGPILEKFKNEREALANQLYEVWCTGLEKKNLPIPANIPEQRITVQGGVGTNAEQNYLIDHFGVDSVGWGTPFLLVPEVMNVDDSTLQKLSKAKEDDLYLSGISPLGVPFNNLRDNDKDIEKMQRTESGKPGSPCTKKYLTFNTEFTERPICTASARFIKQKMKEIESKGMEPAGYNASFRKTIEKSCICEGLTVSALSLNDIEVNDHSLASSVCPGPNMAYFTEITSLQGMIDHIYGRADLIGATPRPHMFVKELNLYVNFLQNKLDDRHAEGRANADYVERFKSNLLDGINYYRKMIAESEAFTWNETQTFLHAINEQEVKLRQMVPEKESELQEQLVCG